MNILGQLAPPRGSRHHKKRLGRGKSSGHGGTSTKGHKGQKARSGYRLAKGFEGGQMSLLRRLPKFGFTNAQFQVRYETVNVSDLNRFDSEVSPELLYQSGLVKKKKSLVKILGGGSLNKKLQVSAHKFSQSAGQAIEKAGGQFRIIKKTIGREAIISSDSTQKTKSANEVKTKSTNESKTENTNEEETKKTKTQKNDQRK